MRRKRRKTARAAEQLFLDGIPAGAAAMSFALAAALAALQRS